MAAPKARPLGDELRRLGDVLYVLAERAETPVRGIPALQALHDAIETVSADVRASVRGRG